MLSFGLCSAEAALWQGDTSGWQGGQESLRSDGRPFILADRDPGTPWLGVGMGTGGRTVLISLFLRVIKGRDNNCHCYKCNGPTLFTPHGAPRHHKHRRSNCQQADNIDLRVLPSLLPKPPPPRNLSFMEIIPTSLFKGQFSFGPGTLHMRRQLHYVWGCVV